MTRPSRDSFPVGTCVKDRETGDVGTVIHHFSDKTIRDVVIVRWFGRAEGGPNRSKACSCFGPLLPNAGGGNEARHHHRHPGPGRHGLLNRTVCTHAASGGGNPTAAIDATVQGPNWRPLHS
jgi:hypothetical protein